MFYLTNPEFKFVEYLQLSPISHLAHMTERTMITQQALCGQPYKDILDAPYARWYLCDDCRTIGTYLRILRPGALAYAFPLRMEPWGGSWAAEQVDDREHLNEADAVGPFSSLDTAWWYVRQFLYEKPYVLPGDVPGIRLAHVLGQVAAHYAVQRADIQLRPGGAQIRIELEQGAPQGTIYKIIEEIDTAARHIGFGALRVPVDRYEGVWQIDNVSISLVFPYPPNWAEVLPEREFVPLADDIRELWKEVAA